MRITPTSGWRSRKYNSTLRGADPNSEHIYGNAIDFTPTNKTLGAVWSAFNKYWRGRKKRIGPVILFIVILLLQGVYTPMTGNFLCK